MRTQYLKLNRRRRYVPTARHNIDTWKNVLWAFWYHGKLRSDSLPRNMVLFHIKDHDHPAGGEGFIDYCIRSGYLVVDKLNER